MLSNSVMYLIMFSIDNLMKKSVAEYLSPQPFLCYRTSIGLQHIVLFVAQNKDIRMQKLSSLLVSGQ